MLDNEVFEFAKEGAPANEQPKEEVKVEIKPYKVFGQDFSLSDPDLIDYYKTRMKMMAIKYRLVGRVDSFGQYKIADPIRYDLVGMEKEIEETSENFYKAIALYMKKHFHFTIKIQQIEDGKAKASLYLSEYVEDFLGLEYIVSHIADFVDVYDADFRVKVRKAFHLVDVNTKIDDFAVPNLAVVMQDAFDLELVVGGLYDMASQIFVMRLLKALEESGDAGVKVLAKYRELLKGKNIEINEKFRYSSYKALLDRAIDELGGYEKLGLDPKVIKSIVKDINGTVKAIDNVSGKVGVLEADIPNKKPKEEKKSSSGAKKSAGTKSAKTEKKPEKKAEKKTDKKKANKKEDKKEKKGGGVSANYMDAGKKPEKKPEEKGRKIPAPRRTPPAREEERETTIPPKPESTEELDVMLDLEIGDEETETEMVEEITIEANVVTEISSTGEVEQILEINAEVTTAQADIQNEAEITTPTENQADEVEIEFEI